MYLFRVPVSGCRINSQIVEPVLYTMAGANANQKVADQLYEDLLNEFRGLYDVFNSRYQNQLDEEYPASSYGNKADYGIINIPIFCFNHGDMSTSKRVFGIIIQNHPTWVLKIPLLKYIFKKILKTVLDQCD